MSSAFNFNDDLPQATDVVVVGAGAAGLCAALAARDAGASVIVLERDETPAGNTALTLGMLPGAGSRLQNAAGVKDTPEAYARDILKKCKGRTDAELVGVIARHSGLAVDWLEQTHHMTFELLDDILYPGHSQHRYHVPPSRSGTDFQGGLLAAAKVAGVQLVTQARVTNLVCTKQGQVSALEYLNGDGKLRQINANAVVLACGGYGADRAKVGEYMSGMADAAYYGHHGSVGDALNWGHALGAATDDLGGYQGHCLADGPRLPVTWALVIRGGFQVNTDGRRFSDEMSGYSEQAAQVLAQPGGVAWTIYDTRCEEPALTFEEYHRVRDSGAVIEAGTYEALADSIGVPRTELIESFRQVAATIAGQAPDQFGRKFQDVIALKPPFRAVKVRGALFHTQGGLRVDQGAQVLRPDGSALPNLFAAGGAARGVSGPSADGYLGGNGLVTAVVLGRLAGQSAAKIQSN